MNDNVILIEYKMNRVTYNALIQVHEFLSSGRAGLALSKLEEVLGLSDSEELS